MGAYIYWDGGQLYFDVTISETHESRLAITEHPVENGADVTDNARRELDRITLEVFVSNSPIVDKNGFGGSQKKIQIDPPKPSFTVPINPAGALTSLAGAALDAAAGALFGGPDPIKVDVFTFDTPFDAVAFTRAWLSWLQDFSKLVTVVTSKATYENMLLESHELKRTRQEADGGAFRLTFKQVRTVSLAFADAPLPTDPRGQGATQKGQKGTKENPPQKKAVDAFLADEGFTAVKNGLKALGITLPATK